MKKVEIYSTPTCGYCKMAKDFMDEHKVAYEEHNVSSDLEKRNEMITKSGQMGVPVISIDGEMMVGYDQDALATALGIAA
jgi:glutaredoxin-like YruB-family protein